MVPSSPRAASPPRRGGGPITRAVALSLIASTLPGCLVTVDYTGRETTPIVEPAEVAYAEVMPDDHEVIGKIKVQCSSRVDGSSARYTPHGPYRTGSRSADLFLGGLDVLLALLSLGKSSSSLPDPCGDGKLERAARERVAEVGGTLIAEIDCSKFETATHIGAECTADVGRPLPKRPLPVPGEVRTRFVAEPRNPTLVPLSPDKVTITAEAPRSALLLGAVLAGCISGCDREKVEPAMRAVAAKVGAGLLSDFSCKAERSGAFVCLSKAWMPYALAASPPSAAP